MGYKRCLDANEFEDISLNKAKRFEYNNEFVSLTDTATPNNAYVKTVISGDVDAAGSFDIQWYDPVEVDTTTETTSAATSLSPASSDCSEFDIPQKAFVPSDDAYFAFDCSPRKSVPIGPNHQASIPVWTGKGNMISELGIYNHGSPSSGLVSVPTVKDNEKRLMGTSVLSMRDSNIHSSMCNKSEERMDCYCLDRGSIRCVQQHVKEARENLKKILGNENFKNLGFCDMGEDVALKWSEEEEDMFHEVVYNNPASMGRNFWKQLSATFHSRTHKEIVSYYFNVFMLRRRAAQNRDRFLDIDSDDDECPARNAMVYGVDNSDDSAVESLGDQDGRIDNQDNYSDEDDVDDETSDDGSDDGLGLTSCDVGNISELDGEIDQRSSNPIQHVDGTPGIPKDNIGVQDDSCMSFECDTNMDMSWRPHGIVDASSALQSKEFKCDQSPRMHGKLDLPGNEMNHSYLLEPCDDKDWYPGYSTCLTKDIDFLHSSNLIDEFFGPGTPTDKNTGSK